jgi:methyl-accepting chemotaxis protein
VRRIFARLSVDKQLYSMLGIGFFGFLIYFTVILVISRQNEKAMINMVENQIPVISSFEKLTVAIAGVQELGAQNGISAGMEGISNLENANKGVQEAFAGVEASPTLTDEERVQIVDAKKRYNAAYGVMFEALSNVVAGLESATAVQTKLQKNLAQLALASEESAALKVKKHQQLSESVVLINNGGEKLVAAGFVMILLGIPFLGVFFALMRRVIFQLKDVSIKLNSAMTQVLDISSAASESSSRLASASTQQAAAVTETVSSMDEIKSMLGHTVENSSAALRSSEESYNEAASGQKVIDDLRVAMLDIDRAYGELEEVNRVVSMIRNKTNVINDIVFKTQLLSFNASIEAARAGQHGRGFSVVAAEVGKLAEVSGVAAQEIGKLLDQSTRKVAQIVESTKYKVDSANQMSLKCASVFESITHRTGEARTMVDSITSAAAEQEAGIQQVSRAMTEMKDSSNQTDTMAHSIQKLSEALQDQSKSLAATIQSLDVLVNGEVGFNDIKTVVQSSSQSVRSMKRDSRRNSA